MRKLTTEDRTLLERARSAAGSAYCPYSDFPVGAAVETERGIFIGCNVENASYSLCQCAERVAIHSAIAAGARTLIRLAVSCVRARDSDPPGSRMPCGACRQVIAEHMASNAEIVVDGSGVWRADELLPAAFQLRGSTPTD